MLANKFSHHLHLPVSGDNLGKMPQHPLRSTRTQQQHYPRNCACYRQCCLDKLMEILSSPATVNLLRYECTYEYVYMYVQHSGACSGWFMVVCL